MPSLALFDPLAVPTQVSEINQMRNALENVPILVGTFWLDFDALSERRMVDALESFKIMGSVPILWTLADNRQESVTEAQLQNLFQSCKEARALRSLELHREAKQLKERAVTTRRDLINWANEYLMPSIDVKLFLNKNTGWG
jgi:hypothetical protein